MLVIANARLVEMADTGDFQNNILERVLSISKIYVFEDKRDHRIRYVGIDDNGKRIGGSYPRILMAQIL